MQVREDRRPSDGFNLGFNPLEDFQFADTVQDFLSIYTPKELEEHGYLQAYFVELLARWGRWQARGRAPALCFEAACIGGLSYLTRSGRKPSELTARGDALLARLLAGLVIDEVEPMARVQGAAVREKAVGIVADEFLARTGSPRVANPAKKRMKKRQTVIKLGQDNQEKVEQISSAERQKPNGLRKMPNAFVSPLSQAYSIYSRKQSNPNDFKPNTGRNPSLEAYDPNYITQVAPNMELTTGPGLYYTDTPHGKTRRKGSNDIEYAQQQPRANVVRSRQGSNPFPEDRFDGHLNRGRQGSIPYSDERPAQVSSFDKYGSEHRNNPNRSYSRKGSADSNFDDRLNDNYYLPRARKPSNAGPHQGNTISPGINYYEYPSPQPLHFYEDNRSNSRGPTLPDESLEFDRRRAGSIDRNAYAAPHNLQRQQSASTPNSPRRGQPASNPRQRFPTTDEVLRQDDRYRPNRPSNMNAFPARAEYSDVKSRRPSVESQPWDEAERNFHREKDPVSRTKTPITGDSQQTSNSLRGSGKTQRQQESRRVDELGEFLSNVLADCEDFLGKAVCLF